MQNQQVQARKCRSCGVLVYDLRHPVTMKTAPIEVEPNEGGNILIDLAAGTYAILKKLERLEYPGQLRLNHFVTCPQAKSWVKR